MRIRSWLAAAVVGLVAATQIVPAAAQGKTLRVVMHSDLKILDPVFSASYIVRAHGYLAYDTLFGIDDKFQVKPQMAESYLASADGLTHTIKLREGLAWHDGTPVTAEDCIASLKRWAARDSLGQKLADLTASWNVLDARTLQIVLKEPFGSVLDALGKPSVTVPFMMPKRIAETDPFKQAAEVIGSGPYIFKRDEWKAGDKVVYVKNPNYKPRSEPANWFSGGKVATLDRIEWIYMPDPQTAVNALINGEIDIIENVSHDLLPILAKATGSVTVTRLPVVNQYQFRMNWLHPPFNNPALRRAAMMALSQINFLDAAIGNAEFYRTCTALFTCGSPFESKLGMDGLVQGDTARAAGLVKAAGYDGTPVVILEPSDLNALKNLGAVAKAQLEKAGFKVDLQISDWQTMVSKLSNKKAPAEGGWNAFTTSWQQLDITDPSQNAFLTANCDKARVGWPCDAEMETIRDRFARETDPGKRKALAEAAQLHNTKVVTHVPGGEWYGASARRTNVQYPSVLPPFLVFWGLDKR